MKKLRRIFFVLVAVILVSCTVMSVGAATKTFSDTEKHWAWGDGQIPYLVDKNVLNGYPDGSFKPDNDVKRAEFIKMLDETFGLTARKPVTFEDVKSTDWYCEYFEKAAAQGYLLNYNNGKKADPETPLTREEAVALLVRYLDLDKNEVADKNTITDYNLISANYRDYVLQAIKADIITGYPDGSFKPSKVLTRAEALTILYKAAGCIYNADASARDAGAFETNAVITKNGIAIINHRLKGRVIVSEGASSGTVTFSGCTIEGTLYIRGNADVYFDKCNVNKVVVEGKGDVAVDTSSVINEMDVNNKNNVRIYANSTVKTLNVNATATGATITGKGDIGKLVIRASNVSSEIMPNEYEIVNNITAVIAGSTYTGSSDSNGVFTVAPYVTTDKLNFYLEFTATKDGTLYYYFTNSTAVPSSSDFDKASFAADLRGSVSAKANKAVSSKTGAVDSLKKYSYMVVMFQSGTVRYAPMLIDNSVETSTGFSTAPYYNESDNSIKFKPFTAGTVYMFYTDKGDALTQSQFKAAYDKTESALKAAVSVKSGTLTSQPLSAKYAAKYSYVALMLKSAAGTNYAPVIVAIADDGFAVLPKSDGSGKVNFKTDVSGYIYYYYSKSDAVPAIDSFETLWRTAEYGDRAKVTANSSSYINYEPAYASVYPYMVISIKDSTGSFRLPVVIELGTANGFSVYPRLISNTQLAFVPEEPGTIYYYFTTSPAVPDVNTFNLIYANISDTGAKGYVNCYMAGQQGFISIPESVTEDMYVVLMLKTYSNNYYAPIVVRAKYNSNSTLGGFVYYYIKDGVLYLKTTTDTSVRYYYSEYSNPVTSDQFYTQFGKESSAFKGTVSATADTQTTITISPTAQLYGRTTIVFACWNGEKYSNPVSINAFQDTTNASGSKACKYVVDAENNLVKVTSDYDGVLYYYTTDSLTEAKGTFYKSVATPKAVLKGVAVAIPGGNKKYLVMALEANGILYDSAVFDTTTWKQYSDEEYDDGAGTTSTGMLNAYNDAVSHKFSFKANFNGYVYLTLVADGKVVPFGNDSKDGNLGSMDVVKGNDYSYDYSVIYDIVNAEDSNYEGYTNVYVYVQGFALSGVTRYQAVRIRLK